MQILHIPPREYLKPNTNFNGNLHKSYYGSREKKFSIRLSYESLKSNFELHFNSLKNNLSMPQKMCLKCLSIAIEARR